MAEELGWVGDEVDLIVRQGQTFRMQLELRDESGAPLSVVGATVVGHIRRRPRAAALIASFVVEFVGAGATVVELSLAEATTAALLAGDSLYDADSEYVYDVELRRDSGVVLPLVWGKLRVHREVTRV